VLDELFARRLVKLTRRTITTRAALLKELERIRRRGVSLNLGERSDDIGAVAAPVFDHEGRCVAAIGISGPLPRFARTRLPGLITAVKTAAAKISQQAGYIPKEHPIASTAVRFPARVAGTASKLAGPRSTGSFPRTSHAS
jgi:DNA-binding IclR family transcriptional regulator